MCLIVLAWNVHPEYKLIIASNRDEFYARPTSELDFWEDHPTILAGRDLQAKGTWLGVNTDGKFAAITNYRDPKIVKENPPSRGKLTTDFLLSEMGAADYLESIQKESALYNGYNLLMYDNKKLCYYSNIEDKVKKLKAGVYALSNHLLDTNWEKVKRIKSSFLKVIEKENLSEEKLTASLFEILKNSSQPLDNQLPSTGVSLEWERAVAPIFINTKEYGTSSSAIILYDKNDAISFSEKRHLEGKTKTEKIRKEAV